MARVTTWSSLDALELSAKLGRSVDMKTPSVGALRTYPSTTPDDSALLACETHDCVGVARRCLAWAIRVDGGLGSCAMGNPMRDPLGSRFFIGRPLTKGVG